jgi:hypothetical protein
MVLAEYRKWEVEAMQSLRIKGLKKRVAILQMTLDSLSVG